MTSINAHTDTVKFSNTCFVWRFLEAHLFQGLAGQVSLGHAEAVALGRQVPHLAVGGPVVQRHRGQVVEGLVQVVGHIGYTSTHQHRHRQRHKRSDRHLLPISHSRWVDEEVVTR